MGTYDIPQLELYAVVDRCRPSIAIYAHLCRRIEAISSGSNSLAAVSDASLTAQTPPRHWLLECRKGNSVTSGKQSGANTKITPENRIVHLSISAG